MAQNLDLYGVPKGGMFDSTDPDNRDPMTERDNDNEDISNSPNVTQKDIQAIPTSTTADQSGATSVSLPNQTTNQRQVKENKIKTPNMAIVDVAIIRTEEIYRSSKGVNLLNGLNLFFTTDSLFTDTRRVRVPPSVSDTFTIKLGTDGAGLNYSLNIFNDNYDRNEVIARPTILVEDKKES